MIIELVELIVQNERMFVERMREMGEPLYQQLRNIFSFGRCVKIEDLGNSSSGEDSADEGDVENPSSP